MTLLICRTCPRYDRRATGQFARDLTAAIRADGRDIPTRNVQCLGGCPDDSVIAVDGPGMTRVRFTAVTSDDAPAIINATLAHQASSTGDPGDWLIPAELTSRISSVTVKRQPSDADGASDRSQLPRQAPPAYRGRPWANRITRPSFPGQPRSQTA
jgi:predicted metal-binding protein